VNFLKDRGVSLVATVGKYSGMDKSLADELKKLPKDVKFESAIAKITEWAIKDIRARKETEQKAISPKLNI
jgi:hypothetical protein